MDPSSISWIDVGYDIQLASLAANIPNLEYCGVAKAFFNLQVVVIEIGCPEV